MDTEGFVKEPLEQPEASAPRGTGEEAEGQAPGEQTGEAAARTLTEAAGNGQPGGWEYAASPAPVETRRKAGERPWLKPVAAGLLVVAVGVGSFFGGMAVGDNDQPKQVTVGGSVQSGQDGQTMPTPGDNRGEGMPGRMGTMGEVTAISASSISVEDMMSGEASTYTINASTEILDNGDAAEVSAIEVGDDVMVVASDADGEVAARIVIDPGMGGPGGQGATPPGETVPDSSTDSTST